MKIRYVENKIKKYLYTITLLAGWSSVHRFISLPTLHGEFRRTLSQHNHITKAVLFWNDSEVFGIYFCTYVIIQYLEWKLEDIFCFCKPWGY